MKTDGKKIYSYESGNHDDLVRGFEKLRQNIEGSTRVEVSSATKTEYFAVWVDIELSSKQREKEYSMKTTVTCIPNNLMKLNGESDYRQAERLEPFTAEMKDKSKREAYI